MADEVVNIVIEEPAEEVVAITVQEVNGDAGYTPIKGVDYFDGEDGHSFVYDDFTPEQLLALKGDAFTYSDFTTEQLALLKGADGFTETRQSILLKLGAATDSSDGFLSRADHQSFAAKQPAGAYILNTSIIRGTKVYHSQGAGDTLGDWRTYSDSAGFYTQYCTVGATIRGNGTWITKNTITI